MENIIKELENAGKIERYEFLAAFKLQQNGGVLIRKNGLYGWFNNEGNIKIPAIYVRLKELKYGYVMATATGWIDLYNTYTSVTEYIRFYSEEEAEEYLTKIYCLKEKNSSELISNLESKGIVPLGEYQKAVKFAPVYYMVIKDEKSGIINSDGEVLIKPECKSILWVDAKYFIAEYDSFFKLYDFFGHPLTTDAFSDMSKAMHYANQLMKEQEN